MTSILLIDLSSIAHPLFHTSASDPNPDATSIRTLERVRALASGQPHVAVCCDAGRSFRRDIDPAYKANRPPSDAALHHQIALVVDALKSEGFPVWAAAGFEADDLIATATTAAMEAQFIDGQFKRFTGTGIAQTVAEATVTIASADKDLLQLVSNRVSIKSLRDGSTIDTDAVVAKFGVRPDQVRDYLSLVGDASDNVKGATGIGEKKAAALLQTFGTLEDLYAAIDRHDAAMQPATLKSLEEFRARWPTVRELIALRTDAPVPFDEVFLDRVPLDVAVFDGGEPMDVEPQVPLPDVVDNEAPPRNAALGIVPATSAPPMPSRIAPDFDIATGPQTYAQAKLMAADLFAAKLFTGYGSPAAVLSTIILGRELGLSVGAALRGFHIVESKHLMHADLIRARAMASPDCEYFRCTERTNEAATFITKRKGDPEPVTLRFTVEDGRKAFSGKADGFEKSGWGRNPADMCVARASSKLARLVYPEAVHGFYAPEEMES